MPSKYTDNERIVMAILKKMGLWQDQQVANACGVDRKTLRNNLYAYEEGRITSPLWVRVGSGRVDP